MNAACSNVWVIFLQAQAYRNLFLFEFLSEFDFIATLLFVSGLLRDNTGSYVASFHLLGGLAYLAGFLVFIIPIVNKWKKKKEKEANKELCDETWNMSIAQGDSNHLFIQCTSRTGARVGNTRLNMHFKTGHRDSE